MSGKMMHLGTVRASQLRGRKRTESPDEMTSVETTRPILPRNDGRTAIAIISATTTGKVEIANRDVARGIAMIDLTATMVGNDTGVVNVTEVVSVIGVVTEIEHVTVEDTTTTATAITITGRIPIPLLDARREVAPGHGEIRSHTPAETNLLVIDTEAEIGDFLPPYNSNSFVNTAMSN